MSDEKKRDRALQRLVRERQEKTGESYQAAWRQLTGDPEESQATAHEEPRNVSRLLLPLSTGPKVLPGQTAQITTRPQVLSFWPDRFLVKNADRWDIHRLTVGSGKSPWSSLIDDEHGHRHASVFSPETWQPLIQREVPLSEAVVAVVTYTGPNEEGEWFEAALFGWNGGPPAKPTNQSKTGSSKHISESAESKSVRVNEMAVLPITIAAPALFVDHFTIADAQNWIVHDIRVRGKSILVQSGDLPGELFSGSAPVVLEPLAANDRVDIAATYVGKGAAACLMVELSGTAEPACPPRSPSYFLPLSTDVEVEPRLSAQITGSSAKNFIPERLVIADPDDWIVNDIRIGNRCQTAQAGDFPAQCFSARAVGCDVTFDRVPKAVDVVVVATREEGCEEGAGFYSGVQGHLLQNP